MSVWLHRWPNGDTSLVWAANPLDAVELLDEVGSAPADALIPVDAGAVHFHLGDDGKLELEHFDEVLGERVDEELYPIIDALREVHFESTMSDEDGSGELPPDELAAAVAAERARLWGMDSRDPAATPEGRALQRELDVCGALADRYVKEAEGLDVEPPVPHSSRPRCRSKRRKSDRP